MGNIFIKSVRNLNSHSLDTNSFSKKRKKELYKQTRMYIFLRELTESLSSTYFKKDETLQTLLPLTTDGANTSFMSLGIIGAYHPKSEKAKKYVREFHDLRGNRLLILTNQRIIFMTIIEYLDEELFYSYPYEEIKKITLKKNTLSYFDWGTSFPPKKTPLHTYFFDFECSNHIFSELLDETDAKILLNQFEKTTTLHPIPIVENTYRKRRFDFFVNNFQLGYQLLHTLSMLPF
ncbi:PH domain-containing protein [Enterococcus sp. LJL51]|uniref:PH domain-containing protein n=1 Tax=Enterococcus sp. LJL51 TaxID=3416656 RepID=UPI003CF0A763